jgi:hypothetical protein
VPDLTAAQVLAAQSDPVLLEQAEAPLARLQESFEAVHNTRFPIETLALRALVHESW